MNQEDRVVVLVSDDDPTGSQTVRNIPLVFDADEDLILDNLAASDCCFVLTNSRSLPREDAYAINARLGRLAALAHGEAALVVVSRGDSTLRGHVRAETEALMAGLQEEGFVGHSPRIFCPAYIEAGRVTVDDIHYCVIDGQRVPVSQTSFAKDAAFGYRNSHLPSFLQEVGATTTPPTSVSLLDVRVGGADHVAHLIREAGSGWLVVNAETNRDIDIVAQAIRVVANNQNMVPIARCGPSLVRALANQDVQTALTEDELTATFIHQKAHGYGLVVVGSHVPMSTRQLDHLIHYEQPTHIEVSIGRVLGDTSGRYQAEVISAVAEALATSLTVLSTERRLVDDGSDGLALVRKVSDFLSAVTRAVQHRIRPAWVIGKGGITSHDIARYGLGIRSAMVVGQLFDGQVTLIAPLRSNDDGARVPYTIFAGNVGVDSSLSDAVRRLTAAQNRASSVAEEDVA